MILDYIFLDEKVCPFCKEEERENFPICQDCYKRLDQVDYSDYKEEISMRLTYPFFYNNFMGQVLASYKFKGETHLFRPLGEFIYQTGLKKGVFDRVDTLIPVPLHRKAQRKRGYNQSFLLARALAEKTGLDLRDDLVEKIKMTKEQNKISMEGRRENLKGSIRVKEEIYSKKVLLVDDVFTSGATINSVLDSMGEKRPVHMEALVLTSGQRIEY